MREATLRQCVVAATAVREALRPVGGLTPLFWALREFARFGVESVAVLGGTLDSASRAALERVVAGLPSALSVSEGGAIDPRVLSWDGRALFDANLAALLSESVGDGPDVLVRRAVLNDGAHTELGVALLDRAVVGSAIEGVAPAAQQKTVLAGTILPAGDADAVLRLRRPALFLDRDGTLNVDHGYVGTRERFTWIEGARCAVRRATEIGWHVFVVTNQSGVARGFYDEVAVSRLHRWMADEVRRDGGTIDDTRYCPHHPDATVAAYRQVSPWRKPAPGMLLDLIRAWQLDPAACVMVGDQPTDIAAAEAAGIRGHLFTGGDLDAFIAPLLQERKSAHGAALAAV